MTYKCTKCGEEWPANYCPLCQSSITQEFRFKPESLNAPSEQSHAIYDTAKKQVKDNEDELGQHPKWLDRMSPRCGGSERPAGVAIIASLFVLFAIITLVTIVGLSDRLPSAAWIGFAWGTLQFALGIGLWSLMPWAWWGSMILLPISTVLALSGDGSPMNLVRIGRPPDIRALVSANSPENSEV